LNFFLENVTEDQVYVTEDQVFETQCTISTTKLQLLLKIWCHQHTSDGSAY